MEYVDIEQVIAADGLRIVLVQGMPSPWGLAAKAMMEFKGLSYVAAPQRGGAPNPELEAWSGVNSAPVVAWGDDPPLNRWNDILLLLERLQPEPALVPAEPAGRVQLFGLAHEICGELGFGWNRRLDMFAAGQAAGQLPDEFAQKYGFNPDDVANARRRSIEFLGYLSDLLAAQQAQGRRFLIGETVTAADFYWATFCNLAAIPDDSVCPLHPTVRPRFENVADEVRAAVSPILLEHRDRILDAFFRLPLEM